jgi:hypothetical protein
VAETTAIAAGDAFLALTAGLEDLDRHAIAGVHAPSLRGAIPDILDHTHGLVPRDEREPRGQVTRVLLVIRSAQSASFDTQQTVIGADRRKR